MKVSDWNLSEALDTKEDIIAHIEVALGDQDMDFLLSIIGSLARSEGMTQIAHELGVTREGLYKSLSPDGNPSFLTVMKLLDILGFQLSLKQKTA
jgi:probable addiction module antidote protein